MGAPRARQTAGVTLDAGALIALERGHGRMIALLRLAVAQNLALRVPAGVIGQTWRGGARQAVLARFLKSAEVIVCNLDEHVARACGTLCSVHGTADVIDASVVIAAREHGDVIITSDPADLRRLDATGRIEEI